MMGVRALQMGSLERDRGEEEGEVLHKKSWLAELRNVTDMADISV